MGSILYNLGGFTLPFFTFGLLNMIFTVAVMMLMPKAQLQCQNSESSKTLTFDNMAKVIKNSFECESVRGQFHQPYGAKAQIRR